MNIKTLILLVFCLHSFAFEVQENLVAGGIKIINFTSEKPDPKVYFYDLPVYVQKLKDNNFQAIIGIPLTTKIGTYFIKIQNKKIKKFNIKQHNYKQQKITLPISKEKYISPYGEHIDRILQEKSILDKARKTWNKKQLIKNFIQPTNGLITSVFGSRRFFNNKAKKPHSGLDITNKLNTDILAANDGEIILVGDFYFNGKTIFIDHGQGLISAYIHLNKILVKIGDKVKQGKLIGTMGESGRTTGVNLHFGIYLNQVAVNPELFL